MQIIIPFLTSQAEKVSKKKGGGFILHAASFPSAGTFDESFPLAGAGISGSTSKCPSGKNEHSTASGFKQASNGCRKRKCKMRKKGEEKW